MQSPPVLAFSPVLSGKGLPICDVVGLFVTLRVVKRDPWMEVYQMTSILGFGFSVMNECTIIKF